MRAEGNVPVERLNFVVRLYERELLCKAQEEEVQIRLAVHIPKIFEDAHGIPSVGLSGYGHVIQSLMKFLAIHSYGSGKDIPLTHGGVIAILHTSSSGMASRASRVMPRVLSSGGSLKPRFLRPVVAFSPSRFLAANNLIPGVI
jgi:hypothetical protein